MEPWFRVQNTEEILSPALLFYPDRIQENITQMVAIAGYPKRLHPHIKTHKCGPIVQMQLKAGITQFKCATLAEAALLAREGASDILLAYPLVGPNQAKLVELIAEYPNSSFSVLVDHPEQLAQWKLRPMDKLGIYVDVNVGMGRTGILPEHVPNLVQLIEGPLKFKGLHVYDGHIHDTNTEHRETAVNKAYAPVEKLLDQLEIEVKVIAGGSPSFPIHAQHPERDLAPGTPLLWDQGYGSEFPEMPFVPAACLLTRVVSIPKENEYCIDLGHKAVASEMKKNPVFFPQCPDAVIKVHSEEHMVIQTATPLYIGDVLYGIPWHICPTVALHEKAMVIKNGALTGVWEIDRKREYRLKN